MTSPRLKEQSGSIPLAILASIVIGGAVVALFLVVQSGVMTSGRDRDFNAAVQVADAGLQDAFVELMAVEIGETAPACDTDGDGTCEGTMQDGSAYRWEYTQIASRMWTVTSVGSFGASTRAVQAEIGERPLFGAAIVTDERFRYNGGGFGTDPFPVGGFQEMIFNGGNLSSYISQLLLYGENNEPSGSGAPDVGKWLRTAGPELPNLGAEAFAENGVCEGESDSLTNPLMRGEIYCLTGQADFKQDTVVAGDHDKGPVRIYVQSGGMSVGPIQLNAAGDAFDLQIYIGAGDAVWRGNASVSAAIYAPKSACTSNGGPGGFSGGVICNTFTLNGNFDYDPTVEAIIDDTFAIRGWREEPSEAQEAAS